jgi:tetratricopeptide (TPR) repeat protein
MMMAIVIEGFSVIVRNVDLAAKYPGGLEAYRGNCPNNTFCADDHLSRIGFMAHGDAGIFIALLAEKGLTPARKGSAEDVALVSQLDGLLQPCSWLELGTWGKAVIAWLAGTERGDLHAPAGWHADKQVQLMSAEELAQRLEHIRLEDNVDVYRDKVTGQELYVGRTAASSDRDNQRHDALYQEACQLVEGLLILNNQAPDRLIVAQREKLDKAIALFAEVVQLNPAHWPAMWLLGKIYQRLDDHGSALPWFTRAHRVNPDQPDVAREASIAAMEVGQPLEAIRFCQRAIEANPADPGLRANLSLALLFSDQPAAARVEAQDALARAPADAITAHILRIIEEVLSGTRPCPHHVRDLQ